MPRIRPDLFQPNAHGCHMTNKEIELRIREFLSILERRDLTPEEQAEMKDLKARIIDAENRIGAIEAEVGIAEDDAAIAQDAIEAMQEEGNRSSRIVKPGAPSFVRSQKVNETDKNLRSWFVAMSPHATESDRRSASSLGALHGLEMRIDPALAIKTDVGGNHIISQTFLGKLITELHYSCPWLSSGATVVNTTTDGVVRVPKLADDLEATVIAEKAADTEKPPVLDEVQLAVSMLTSGMVACSWEAMQDSSINLPAMLATTLGGRIGRGLDRLISLGGDPNFAGFFKQTVAAAQVLKAGTATKVTMADLIKLVGKLDRSYSGPTGNGTNLRWVMNLNTLTALRGETATGSGEFLVTDPITGSSAQLLGIPVIVANHADDPAAGKRSVWLADLSRNLFIRQHLNISLRRSSDFAFDRRSDVFVSIARYGSKAGVDTRAVACIEG